MERIIQFTKVHIYNNQLSHVITDQQNHYTNALYFYLPRPSKIGHSLPVTNRPCSKSLKRNRRLDQGGMYNTKSGFCKYYYLENITAMTYDV